MLSAGFNVTHRVHFYKCYLDISTAGRWPEWSLAEAFGVSLPRVGEDWGAP